MNISGIRPITGAYGYNEIQKVKREPETAAADQVQQAQELATSQPTDIEPELPASRTTDTEPDHNAGSFGKVDYAKQYQPDAVYDMKGADSDIHSLDVEQALSDMKKDQVLQQYLFFVGNGQEGVRASAEMPVANTRKMENFDL